MKKLLLTLLLLAFLPTTLAFVEIQSIETDPGVIAAGDEVDIIIDYEIPNLDKAGDPDWKLSVKLEADDDISEEFLRISDTFGDDLYTSTGTTVGATMTKRTQYRIKVAENAPTGEYELILRGMWYYKGEPEGAESINRITIDVQRAGILPSIASITSNPQRLVPGTREAVLNISVANNGETEARNVVMTAELPEGMRPSHAEGTRSYLGVIGPASITTTTLMIDLDKELASGNYEIPYTLTYLDESQNEYEINVLADLYVAKKPRLVIIDEGSTAKTGDEAIVSFIVRNEGEVAAEAIDARLLKESSQPFILDTRSSYISKLEPGEEARIKIPVQVEKTAIANDYTIPVLIRAKGDSDENDNTIYTFRDTSTVTVEEENINTYIIAAIAILMIIGFSILLRRYK